ncbi:hypothetical protein Pcinc_042308 [Petrolisthes cinctipes]|uniref:Uncharacterized protein n=1 Tax=Petrolisthes cinctipes TaxID=88211 RepID=A0AAE1BJ11_PETCI|nr:hypothetical protein Pcinc_042308 [Petrolisthes cinctipes]
MTFLCPQSEHDWPVSESGWSGLASGSLDTPPLATPSPSSSYGVVDPRRHSAYLRPFDQIPPHLPPSQLPPSSQHLIQTLPSQGPPSLSSRGALQYPIPTTSSASTTSTLPKMSHHHSHLPPSNTTVSRFQPEHESSV